MKRNEVDPKYIWHTEDIFASDADWEKELNATSAEVETLAAYQGKLGDRATCLEALNAFAEINKHLEKLYCYTALKNDEDQGDSHYSGLKDRATSLLVAVNTALAYLEPELSALEDKVLDAYIADPAFSDFSYMLSEIKRVKAHILSDKEERLLSMAAEPLGAVSNAFRKIDSVDVPFGKIKDENGKTAQLTHGSYSYFLSVKDARVRRDAFKGVYKAYGSLINTLSALYSGNVKRSNFYAKARGYESAIAGALYADNVPTEVYSNLIESVHKGLPAVHDYVSYRKQMLGGEQHMYDMYVPITESGELKCNFEESFDMVLEGLKPLGAEYRELLLRAKNEGWIDVCETEGKRSGAYMMGVYGVHPYVLLNHTLTTHAVFTIAHELGHAMHTYYSQKNQPYMKSDYAIFVAEVASTVNEVLLLKHMIANAEGEFKKYLLSYYLDMFRTTIYRQTMFAEFEAAAHQMDMEGKPLTPDSLSELYYGLNKTYYGKGVTHDKEIRYEWARIPHFYTPFYVYKYATGLTAAVDIARGILKGDRLDMYKNFLSAGGCMSPYEVLKLAGVDLKKSEPFEAAAAEFAETLAQLKAL